MSTKRWPLVLAPSLLTALAACTGDADRAPPLAPTALSSTSSGFISGRVLGPSGSICASLPSGTRMVVRPINLQTQSLAGQQVLFCPADAYSFSVPDGTYLLRLELPADESVLAGFPWRTITVPPVDVAGSEVVRDLPVPIGTPLGGGATIEGQPLEGMSLTLTYDQAPIFGGAFTSSGPDGAWMEFFGRSPARLQAGVRFAVSAVCEALGGILQQAPPNSFLFPDEASGVACRLGIAPATQFSHDLTRVVVTPLPGDIGGLDPGLAGQFGMGWGVQFPVPTDAQPAHGPIARSELFRGGLLVGIRPDRVLSGVDLSGYAQCAPQCRDFGLDARLTFASSPQFGRKVLWQYSDAPSVEGVGLKVLQQSFDGQAPADYVLFRFVFTNSGAAPVTFYVGMFADWDIGDDPSDDVGATDPDRRLMYMTNESGGSLAGSLLLSHAPVSGNTFRSLIAFPPPMSDYVSALAGDVQTPTAETPGDYLYLHAVGPITLDPEAVDELWIAIVAGEDLPQLHANAAAAASDVARRRASGEAAHETTSPRGSTVVDKHLTRSLTSPMCKTGCSWQ